MSHFDYSQWNLPHVSERRLALRVTDSAETHIRRGHPWLFDRSITRQSHAGQAGDLAVVFDRKQQFLAIGLFDPASPVRVKLLHHGKPTAIDSTWFERQISRAIERRATLSETNSNGMRLIHGENDGLPALILDRYAGTLVMKLYSAAWFPHLPTLLPLLNRLTNAERLVLRLSRLVQLGETFNLHDGQTLWGTPPTAPVLFQENGLTFEADVIKGQKTGHFLDQRDNRLRVQQLAAGKHVLDVFACTGGFSVYAMQGGAKSVLAVDSSQPALAAARRNRAHNPQLTVIPFDTVADDAFDTLGRLQRKGRRFDLVVLDPPSFAQRKRDVSGALNSYQRLVRSGVSVLNREGILVAASCSSRVSADLFFDTVHRAATSAGRPLREIERTGHALDHPIGFKEGAYLKCLFAYA